jgi:L-amino acid N-acyltransferase YncA
MAIRAAREGDLEAVLSLYVKLYDTLMGLGMRYELDGEKLREMLPSQMKSKLCHILVSEEDGEINGFISASVSRIERRLKGGLVGVINDIYVETQSRGKGTASELLKNAEEWMRSSGAQSATCDIVVGNENGRGFWRAQGYEDMSISTFKPL